MKLCENNFTCLPFVVYVRAWDEAYTRYSLVTAYLGSDGKYHLDEESLNLASETLKTPVNELRI